MKRLPLKTARKCAGMRKELVCAAMGIDEDTLTHWEDGKEIPTVDQAITISKLYGMPMDAIGFTKGDNRLFFDHTALRKQILSKFGTIAAFAKAIDMKPATLRNRLDMKSEFRYEEMLRIANGLQLSGDELTGCFFSEHYSYLIPICLNLSMLSADEYAILKKLIEHGYKGPDLEEV